MEGYLPIPYPLWSCNCDSVPWVVMGGSFSLLSDGISGLETSTPSAKCTQSRRHPPPLHITWSLHPSSVDAPVDVHGRSCNFPLIHPRNVLLAWNWVITRPLSTCGVFLLSLPLVVGIGWHCKLALSQPHVLASWPFCPLPASWSFALWFDVISPPTHSFVGGTAWSTISSCQGVYTFGQWCCS